mmetsp:Transcript_6313/g.12498  ORF Transcript_6313/g.12498 Transcript_6313/m.12498 type:complete len:264 (-) Transcript_6313:634-1425(-)
MHTHCLVTRQCTGPTPARGTRALLGSYRTYQQPILHKYTPRPASLLLPGSPSSRRESPTALAPFLCAGCAREMERKDAAEQTITTPNEANAIPPALTCPPDIFPFACMLSLVEVVKRCPHDDRAHDNTQDRHPRALEPLRLRQQLSKGNRHHHPAHKRKCIVHALLRDHVLEEEEREQGAQRFAEPRRHGNADCSRGRVLLRHDERAGNCQAFRNIVQCNRHCEFQAKLCGSHRANCNSHSFRKVVRCQCQRRDHPNSPQPII